LKIFYNFSVYANWPSYLGTILVLAFTSVMDYAITNLFRIDDGFNNLEECEKFDEETPSFKQLKRQSESKQKKTYEMKAFIDSRQR
jgi:hypothetical protein